MPERIGLIGVGLLGTALAERLLAAGYALTGFDIEPLRIDTLRSLGGAVADSPAEVVRSCRRTVLCLPDSRVVNVVIGKLEAVLTSEMILIDTTTGDPVDTAAIAGRLAARGVGYVDATVVGSSAHVRAGEAIALIGGAAESVDAARDVLAAFAMRQFHVGPCGSGARMKLVVNLVLGLNRAVLAEGLGLAKSCGLNLAQTLEVLQSGAAYSAVMDSKGQKMIAGDFTPHARLAQHLKDVRLILDLGDRLSAQLPLSVVHRELLERAIDLGFGDLDNSAICKAFEAAESSPRQGSKPLEEERLAAESSG